ncbi:retrovirus-related pol polyprotein from transposon TNT 1-94 [Tanacetum coccineum]
MSSPAPPEKMLPFRKVTVWSLSFLGLPPPLAEAKPTGIKVKNWALLDRQALGAARLSLAKNVAYNVVNEKTTYGLFKALSNMLMSVDIKFNDEVQALLLLSLLPESWSGTVTAVSGLTRSTKLKFDNTHDLIRREDIRRKTSEEYLNSLLSAEDKGRGRKQDRGHKQNRSRSKSKKRDQSKNRQDIIWIRRLTWQLETIVCCVENTIDDRIMDSGASFHATYCKEEIESWTLKDVRYIPGLKKRLISVGQLDEEGYHVGFGDQQWKVTKGSLVVARGNKRGSLYMVEVPSDGINAAIDGRGNTALWHQRLGHMSEKGMKILASKGKEVSLAHLRVFGYDSYVKVKDVAKDKLKSVKCTFIGHGSDEMDIAFGIRRVTRSSEEPDDVILMIPLYVEAKATTNSRAWLSSEITQSPVGSSDASEGSENSGSYEDSRRSDKEDSEDRASSKEGGSKTPHLPKFPKSLSSEIYMTQPEGFQSAGKEENLVCKLKKSLYRLKQALRQCKKQAPKRRELPDKMMLKVPYCLQLFGSVMYTMVCTRPDITHAVGIVSRFMSNPGREHWKSVKWRLRYLKGTSKATLCFSRKEVVLEGFSDSDYGGCLDSAEY